MDTDKVKTYSLSKQKTIPFNNHVYHCIGTGRMGLALQTDAARVTREILPDYENG